MGSAWRFLGNTNLFIFLNGHFQDFLSLCLMLIGKIKVMISLMKTELIGSSNSSLPAANHPDNSKARGIPHQQALSRSAAQSQRDTAAHQQTVARSAAQSQRDQVAHQQELSYAQKSSHLQSMGDQHNVGAQSRGDQKAHQQSLSDQRNAAFQQSLRDQSHQQ